MSFQVNTMVGRFVKVKCECKNEQVIFEKAASEVHCLVCDAVLAEPKGGMAEVKAKVLEFVK